LNITIVVLLTNELKIRRNIIKMYVNNDRKMSYGINDYDKK